MENADVVVVGAGPTGMTVAGDLARAGRTVVVLERWPSRNPASRAFAVMARTLEVLDSRGLTDDLVATGATAPRVNLWPGAALQLDRLDSPYPFALVTPQTNVDAALEGYAVAQGAAVRRGVEVEDVVQDGEGVTVTGRGQDGARLAWRAGWVVAADGSHSSVRGLLGVDFPGRAVLTSVVLADIRPTHPPEGGALTVGSTAREFGFLAPYGNGWFRSMTWDRARQLPDTAAVEDAEIGAVLDRAMGRHVGVEEIGWRSRFSCEERQVERYRHGRVLLAGDAAHVHSPVGGQGMNTGIQDAVNLGWKLAAVLAGADDAVLDTYHSERHPIGKRVVRQSGLMLRSITLRPRPARALRTIVGTRLLNYRPFADLVAGSFSGVGLRYPSGHGEHDLVGTRATQVPLAEGPLARLLRGPGFLLVRENGSPAVDFPVGQAQRTDDGPALLVRPDAYVAWAGSTTEPSRHGTWADALARWTGAGAREAEHARG